MTQHCINIYRSRKQLTLIIIGGLGFAGLGAFMLWGMDTTPLTRTIALCTIIFFGCCAAAGIYFLLRRKSDPAVILTPESITIRNGDGSRYEIGWPQITDFEPVEWLGQVVLAIRIADPGQAIADETNPAYRKSLEFNLKNFGTPYCLILSMLDYPKGALLPMLRNIHNKYANA